MNDMSKIANFFEKMSAEEKAEMISLFESASIQGSNLIVKNLSAKTFDLSTFAGQQEANSQGFELKFGMAATETDEDGMVSFEPLCVVKKEGQTVAKLPGIRKAEVVAQDLTAGKGRMSMKEIGEVWKLHDVAKSNKEIAEILGRKEETIYSILQKARPVSI